MGGDYFALCLALEELGRVDSSVAITLEAGVGLGIMPIYRFGTEEQKRQWLPRPVRGRDAGRVRADRAGRRHGRGRRDAHPGAAGGRRVGDRRVEVVHHQLRHVDHRRGRGRRGHRDPAENGKPEISTILVPSGTPGFTVAPKYSKVGWSGSDTHELSFDGCRVPEANLLGERGRGYAQFLRDAGRGAGRDRGAVHRSGSGVRG